MSTERENNIGFNPFKAYETIEPESYVRARYSAPLQGEVVASGAKNMVTKVVAAALSSDGGVVKVRNVPWVGDLAITLALCDRLGVGYKFNTDKTLELHIDSFASPDVKSDPYHGNRIGMLFAGPVLSKLGRANISRPEGDKIGERKVDFHLDGLRQFGVDVNEHDDYYSLQLKRSKLQGAHVSLPFPSVGATENLVITASCAEGRSVLDNCALEPEIIEMVKILQRSGVKIQMFSNRTIVVEGGKHTIVSPVEIIPDRLEVASFAVAALSSRGDVFVRGADHNHLVTFLGVLQSMGAGIEIQEDGIRFFYKGPLKSTNIETDVYPGFATDHQQPIALLMTQAIGQSVIHETIFEDRFRYLLELDKISSSVHANVDINCPNGENCRFSGLGDRHTAYINGPISFGQGELTIPDLRAGFAVINAAILSNGVEVKGIKSLYRGYEDPVGKLKSLGADISLTI